MHVSLHGMLWGCACKRLPAHGDAPPLGCVRGTPSSPYTIWALAAGGGARRCWAWPSGAPCKALMRFPAHRRGGGARGRSRSPASGSPPRRQVRGRRGGTRMRWLRWWPGAWWWCQSRAGLAPPVAPFDRNLRFACVFQGKAVPIAALWWFRFSCWQHPIPVLGSARWRSVAVGLLLTVLSAV